MSDRSTIHDLIHQHLFNSFGSPANSLGRDDHWELRPTPNGVAIHILVNGTGELPAVWVFDPHPRNDGVMRQIIERENDIVQMIEEIKTRLEQAAKGGGRCELA